MFPVFRDMQKAVINISMTIFCDLKFSDELDKYLEV